MPPVNQFRSNPTQPTLFFSNWLRHFYRLPVGGNRRHKVPLASCPLYPRKRTLVERVGMSASCQKRTFCGAANLFWHVLPNLRQQLSGAVGFRHIIIAASRPRLFAAIEENEGAFYWRRLTGTINFPQR